MSDALEKSVRLSGDVIEKLRELKNRDAPRKPSELKSKQQKTELNNYGLFEDNKDS
jgi:hypothetical protein